MIERVRLCPELEPLVYWAKERESIRKLKASGAPPPWTKDPILQTYRFCNLRRRDDRVSQWLIKNILNPYRDTWSYLQFTALCRWVNWPPTIQELVEAGFSPSKSKLDFQTIGECLSARMRSGEKTWTGAYMITAAGRKGDKGMLIASQVVGAGLESVRKPLQQALATKSVKATTDVLKPVMGWGSFMAGQVVADWTYTPLLASAEDLYAWAPKGPGSVRGHNRIMRLPVDAPPPKEAEWCVRLIAWRYVLVKTLGPEYEDLALMDVQNALCETDKYLRVKNAEGRPRATYKPETRF